MATVRREILTRASPADVWDAIRDVGAVHKRLAPGFIIDAKLNGSVRTITFADGTVVREPIVSLDDVEMRLVWTAVGVQSIHYNASAQVFPATEQGSRILWLVDILPDSMVPNIEAYMNVGGPVMQRTLDKLGK